MYIFSGFLLSIHYAGIHDKFAAALTKAVQTLRVGHGFDEGVTQVVIDSVFFSSP